MSDLYTRKFRPKLKHIIAFILLIISLGLFFNGFKRASRVTSRLNPEGFVFDDSEIRKNRGVLFKADLCSGKLKDTQKDEIIDFKHDVKGFFGDREVFISRTHTGGYQFAAVKLYSSEYKKLLNGEEVTGYFSDEYSDDLKEFASKMGQYYEDESVIPAERCSELGIMVVNRKKELFSFLWGVPFLIAGAILIRKAGDPFFYEPVGISE